MGPRQYKRLSVAAVKANEASGKRGFYSDGDGLAQQVTTAGVSSWIYRYMLHGVEHKMGLGPTRHVSLSKARDLAAEARQLRRAGGDPLETRRAEKDAKATESAKVMTFRQCAKAYIAAHQAGWKNAKHTRQWPTTLETFVYPILGDVPVQLVDVGLVMKAIEPIWTTKPETASRIRGRIESVLDWAKAREYREGENPARWRGHLENLLAKRGKVRRVKHFAALPYCEISAFMAELQQLEGIAPRALEFLILTATRVSEAAGARWDEFNLAERIWVIPPERMKAAREHRIPLSDAAMTVLSQMAEIRSGPFVFPGLKAGSLSGSAMPAVLDRMSSGDQTTVHGLRSSFRDWAAERTIFPREVAELALAHAVGDAVERAYQRSDLFQKRQQIMDAWAYFCSAPAAAGDVVAISAARR
jgi:integrase